MKTPFWAQCLLRIVDFIGLMRNTWRYTISVWVNLGLLSINRSMRWKRVPIFLPRFAALTMPRESTRSFISTSIGYLPG
ncbi:hypothetical protein C8P63_10683 [Melghirimyces profundicolus]|uniref:Uncharacterized protein n=1 Tax=Melghirimyces profundicolus TaxID=1242148 RepID=A0A2T6C0J5_9BACL|nr:hypothetical protein C8P63_10683 [Melghirimyces profundicolus]